VSEAKIDVCQYTPVFSVSNVLRASSISTVPGSGLEDQIMDKDRVAGSAKVVKGKIKEAVGKAVGDVKLEAEGKTDKIEGAIQNAVGGLKDTIKGE
jgi:uncharacterized protein YjbJ (UPF0337 family)